MTNLSVTGIIHNYHIFDREFWLSYKVLESLISNELWEILKQILLRTKRIDPSIFDTINKEEFDLKRSELDLEWRKKNEEAKLMGTTVHEMIRNQLITDINLARKTYRLEGEVQSLDQFLLSLGGLFPEQRLEISLDQDYLLVGIADLISIKDGIVDIIDWKTDEDGIKFKSRYDMAKKQSKKLKYPLSKLDDVNGIHYQLLLSLYMHMILLLRPDLKPGKLKIVWIKDGLIKNSYEVPYLEKEINSLLKWHLKATKLKLETIKCREIDYEEKSI